MSRLRILHLGKYYPPVKGGIETVVETLCRGEAAWADTAALVINNGPQTVVEQRDGVDGHTRRKPDQSGCCVTRTSAAALAGAGRGRRPRAPRAESDGAAGLLPRPTANAARRLVPQRGHSGGVEVPAVLRAVARIRASPSRPDRRGVAAMRDVPALARYRDKCVVVPYGLDVDRYRLDHESSLGIEPAPGATRRPTFLFVGRLVRYKGVDVLLKALHGLDAELSSSGAVPCATHSRAWRATSASRDRVRFLGEVSRSELLELVPRV